MFILEQMIASFLYLGNKSNDFVARVASPIDFKGQNTGRLAKQCHSSDALKNDSLNGSNALTQSFIKNCWAEKNSRSPFLAFAGDSHTLSMFPLGEKLSRDKDFSIFSLSRDGCTFPEQGKTSRKGCVEVMKSTENYLVSQANSRRKESVVIATSYLNSHFGFDGYHRRQFKKHPGGTTDEVRANLRDYALSLKRLADKLRSSNSHLIVVAPLPQHPLYLPEICTEQWFKPIWGLPKGCNQTSAQFLQKQRKHIIKALRLLEKDTSNLYVYEPFHALCENSECSTRKNGKFLYSDDDHLSANGIDYMYGHFVGFMRSKKLL
ncbi:MAG: hypothetical protein HQ469_11455 [Cyanobacteria bacterium]|nr:hypothetical protein [Cyanobacteria bacterium bin.275]